MSNLVAGHQSLLGGGGGVENLAPELEPYLVEWLAEDAGELKGAITAGVLTSNWGGNGVTSISAGVTGDKCLMNEVARLNTTGFLGSYATGDSIAHAIFLDVDSSTDDSINIGLGRNSTPGIDRAPFNCIQLNASGGAGTVQLHIFDYGPPQVYVDSTPYALADGSHLLLAAYNPSDKTWRLYLDDAGLIGSATLLAHPPTESVVWVVVEDNPGKAAFTTLPQAQIEQWPVFLDTTGAFVPDAGHCTYLWSNGYGKTKTQFDADAAA